GCAGQPGGYEGTSGNGARRPDRAGPPPSARTRKKSSTDSVDNPPTPFLNPCGIAWVAAMSDITLRAELIERGFGTAEIARLVRAGELTRLRRGAYVDSLSPDAAPAAAH